MIPPRTLTRRTLLGAGIGLGALLAAGCATPAAPPAPAAPPTAGFPVTLPHAFGSTTLTGPPARVVLVGFKEQDYFLALGTVPVGIREWFGKKPYAVWPWAEHLLGGAQPTVLPRADINYEQVAALKPDVIVGLSAGLTQEQYDRLAGIAPTVAQPSAAGDYTISWQDMTRTTGQILGKQADAEQMVTDLEARIAAARAQNPAFEGASTVLASATDGQYYLYGPGATGALVLASLGMKVPDEIVRLADNADAYYLMSPERFDLTNVDLAVWSEAATDEGPKALLANPLYADQPVHREGRDLFLGLDKYNGALVFSSVLSLPMVLDELVPQFAEAIDGDPATRPALTGA
jgi:iron complex transport system substrate-binding protein